VENEYPMEAYILKVLHENKYNIDAAASIVYNKYPFTKKGDLKKVISELICKKLNNEKIGGIWVKLKNKFKLVSKNYMDLAHDPRPAWDNSSKCGSDVGRANRFAIEPSGHDVDRPDVPKLDEVENIDEVQRAFEQLKNKFANALPGIDERELERVVKEEMRRMGFDISHLEGQG
jgi:hypothetical protein